MEKHLEIKDALTTHLEIVLKQDQVARKALAERIRMARTDSKSGWSQAQLATLLGVNQTTISRFERTGSIDYVTLTRLAIVCNKKLSTFFSLDERIVGKPEKPEHAEWLYQNRDRPNWSYFLAEGRWGTAQAVAKHVETAKHTKLDELKAERAALDKKIALHKRLEEKRSHELNPNLFPQKRLKRIKKTPGRKWSGIEKPAPKSS